MSFDDDATTIHDDNVAEANPITVRRRGRWVWAAIYQFGACLLTVGMLILGFAVWQLWGTGLQTAAAQDDLAEQFESQSAEFAADALPTSTTIVKTTTPATTTTAPATTIPVTTVLADESADPTATTAQSAPVTAASAPPSTVIVTQTTTVPSKPTSSSNWFKVQQGDVVARIQAPEGGIDAYVVAGVRVDDLKKGPGHHPASVFPGQLGNSVISGHRTTYGSVFGDIDQMAVGDKIIVTLPTGDRYTYQVTSTEVIEPSEFNELLGYTSDAQLTLVTCTPKYTARQRLVVHSTLVAAESSTLWDAPPDPMTQYIDVSVPVDVIGDEGEELAMQEVEVVDPDTGDMILVDIPADVDPADVKVVDGEIVLPDSGPVEGPVDSIDGLSGGWFADRSAIWLSLKWAAVLLTIWLIARFAVLRPLRRRIGRPWPRRGATAVAALVFLVPFLFCLYWFYDAVARLLPAGI